MISKADEGGENDRNVFKKLTFLPLKRLKGDKIRWIFFPIITRAGFNLSWALG